jgi:hypothetical protein
MLERFRPVAPRARDRGVLVPVLPEELPGGAHDGDAIELSTSGHGIHPTF